MDKDEVFARECFERAADMGHAAAQRNLAGIYEIGLGGPRDMSKAVECYEAAAAQGDAEACFVLGTLLACGNKEEGILQDTQRAMTLFGRAAAQGHPQAMRQCALHEERMSLRNDVLSVVQRCTQLRSESRSAAVEIRSMMGAKHRT